mmetsp:Transcript_25423/g.37430  ORF Transcript_25423/g.37430 Transcript_25423/m.37430 type:complete len:109 (+) Transcript_25423:360-686(+)
MNFFTNISPFFFVSLVVATVFSSCAHELRGSNADANMIHNDQSRNLQESDENHWAECLGRDGNECRDFILSQYADMEVVLVPPKTYDFNRIWIYVNHEGIVESTPGRG